MGAGYIWDDDTLLTENPQMRSLQGLAQFWRGDHSRDYTPVTLSAFWLEWRAWGDSPAAFHLVNILLHGVCVILLWRILVRLRIPGAWLAGLLFAIHPVSVASVAWIAELKNTLSGALFFGSILCFLIGRDDNRRTPWIACIALFTLAALAKGAVVTLPAVLLLCILWRERKLTRRDLIQLIPYAIVALAAAWLTVKYQARAQHYQTLLNGYGYDDLPIPRLLNAGRNIWLYLVSLFWPTGMSPLRPRSVAGSPIALLAAIALFILLAIKRHTWGRPFLFAYAYYLIMLLPVLGFFWMTFMQQAATTDWWQYLAAPGIFACVAGCVVTAARRWRLVTPIFGAFLALLLVQTWLRADIYHSMYTYCSAVVAEDPSEWTLQNNLGILYKRQGRFAQALSCFGQAAYYNPGFTPAYINAVNTLVAEGNSASAEKLLRNQINVQPYDPDLLEALSDLLDSENRVSDAIPYQRQAAQADPANPGRFLKLGDILLAHGQFRDAESAFRAAIDLVPDSIPFRIELCQALLAQSKLAAARQVSDDVNHLAAQSGNPADIAASINLRQLCDTFPGR